MISATRAARAIPLAGHGVSRVSLGAALTFLALASVPGVQPAQAMQETRDRPRLAFVPSVPTRGATVPAGRTTTLGFLVPFNPGNCQVQRSSVSRASANNGRVGTSATNRRLTPAQVGAVGRKCAGTLMRGTAVTYTPAPGFRGAERVNVRLSYGNGLDRRSGGQSFSFTVR